MTTAMFLPRQAMIKPIFTIGILPPSQHASRGIYARVKNLLHSHGETLSVRIVDVDLNTQHKTPENSQDRLDIEASAARVDMFIAWDFPALYGILAETSRQPIIYGVTLDHIREERLPIHPRIVGYVSDTRFLHGLLLECGIPLERLFLFTACMDKVPRDRMDSRAYGGQGILLIADDNRLIDTVTAACGVLGLRLERLPYHEAEDMPPDFYARYDAVIASGPVALAAAARGAAVIVADERGGAGLLTPDKLHKVLDARGGPACFDTPIDIEFFLAVLSDRRALAAARLLRELCDPHSEAARARQWSDWLRPLGKAIDSGSHSKIQWLSFSWHNTRTVEARVSAPPQSEVLVDGRMESWLPTAVPSLPLDCLLAATADDRDILTGVLGQGWAHMESWGCWSDGDIATLCFQAPVLADAELVLYLRVHAYLPPGRVFQRVAVRVNGRLVLCWKVRGLDSFPIPLHREYLGDSDSYDITLHLPDAEQPSAWGRRDSRRLGLGLVSLNLASTLGSRLCPPCG